MPRDREYIHFSRGGKEKNEILTSSLLLLVFDAFHVGIRHVGHVDDPVEYVVAVITLYDDFFPAARGFRHAAAGGD